MMKETTDSFVSYEGQVLIAMPSMSDERFARSVVYICAHSPNGAMGLIINKLANGIDMAGILNFIHFDESQTNVTKADMLTGKDIPDMSIFTGGPVETHRGFVLHSDDYFCANTSLKITSNICLTASMEILKRLYNGDGPQKALFALGYAGWTEGQLEAEILANGWLTGPVTDELLFGVKPEQRYPKALESLGISIGQLVGSSGHA